MKQNMMAKAAYQLLCVMMLVLSLSTLGLTVACGAPSTPTSNQNQAQETATPGENDEAAKIALPAQVVVDVTIDCSEAVAVGNEIAIAQAPDGKLFAGKVAVNEGQSALDALRATGLAIVTQDFSGHPFVDSIQGLASGATSAMSGWTYTINGEMLMVGMDEAVLAEGDVLIITYINEFE
ncbi:MAG: DUF4430 domain-containing protein [Coriobacteriales bacterium]|jgi:hypothetical protein|nr:DUF4430 domain-containing protein [Coriobacteriales bacterium]